MQMFRGQSSEQGVSLVEQVLAAFFIGFLVLVWVNSIRATTKGTLMSKNNLRAQNLGLSKLEDVKNTAMQASYGQTWSSVTNNAMVIAYRTPQISQIEKKSFTWRVQTDYVYLPLSSTPAAEPTLSSVSPTANLWIRAAVSWQDITGPKTLTMTGYSTNVRQ